MDQASYFAISLQIYQAADHRNPADIYATWENLFDFEHGIVEAQGEDATQLPYEHIVSIIIDLAHRLGLSESIFEPYMFIKLLEKYAFEYQRGVGPPTWIMDVLIDINMPFENIKNVLETMIYHDEQPFTGGNRRIIANHLLYVLSQWFDHCTRTNQRTFGGVDQASKVQELVGILLANNLLQQPEREQANDLQTRIQRQMR